jgi:hypothetical protein
LYRRLAGVCKPHFKSRSQFSTTPGRNAARTCNYRPRRTVVCRPEVHCEIFHNALQNKKPPCGQRIIRHKTLRVKCLDTKFRRSGFCAPSRKNTRFLAPDALPTGRYPAKHPNLAITGCDKNFLANHKPWSFRALARNLAVPRTQAPRLTARFLSSLRSLGMTSLCCMPEPAGAPGQEQKGGACGRTS